MSISLKYKTITEDAVIPSHAYPGDAGLDLTATKVTKSDWWSIWYNTDIAVEIPAGHFGMLVPRSSISNDGTLMMANNCGIIDAGFRGGIQVRFNRTLKGFFNRKKQYNPGDRIAQLIIVPFKTVKLEKVIFTKGSARDTKGHGSSGK